MERSATNDWLAVLGHPAGLSWVLANRRLAFEAARSREVKRLHAGDRVLLYAAKAAYKPAGPGGVIGSAVAATGVAALHEALTIERRDYTLGAELDVQVVMPYRESVEIPPLLDQLRTFPQYGPRSWMTILRRPLLRLMPGDADVLLDALKGVAKPPDEVIPEYVGAG